MHVRGFLEENVFSVTESRFQDFLRVAITSESGVAFVSPQEMAG